MKRFIFLLSLIFLISTASAELIETKQAYAPGETLIAKLNFIPLQPISSSQIQLLKESHIQVPSESEVVRLGNDYFIYSSLPLNQTNLNLRIKDVYRMSAGSQIFGNIEVNISLQGNTVPYYILPGVMAAREPGMDFRVISLLDSNQQITVQEQDNKTINLSPGENKIRISTENIPQGFSILHFGDYQIPLYLDAKTTYQSNYSANISDKKIRLEWFPRRINGVILADRETKYSVTVVNTGTEKIKDILIEYDGSVFLIPSDRISYLDVNESFSFDVTIKKSSSSLDQVITARYGNEAFDLPITILVTTNPSEINGNISSYNSSATDRYCLELNGKVCSSEEVCSSNSVKTIDQSQCCLGSCVQGKKKSNSWIGYLIGAIILVILVIVGGRYIKARKPEDSFAKRVESAERKI